jgi:hypothetical protein
MPDNRIVHLVFGLIVAVSGLAFVAPMVLVNLVAPGPVA